MPSQVQSTGSPTVVVLFGKTPSKFSDTAAIPAGTTVRFAETAEALAEALRDADGLLCWEPDVSAVGAALPSANRLRWIQWPFIGMDRLLPLLTHRPEILLTNAGGVFDEPIAEYVLALVLSLAKDLPGTWLAQHARKWEFRVTETIAGRHALIVGVGGVGRAIGAKLRSVGMVVAGMGRTARAGDTVFSSIAPVAELETSVASADYVISAAPLTAQTRNLFSEQIFARMVPTARFINVGRGELVDEQALQAALRSKRIAGAALDVFQTEPLPGDSPLWAFNRLIVSPHMAGDVRETPDFLASLFTDNLIRFVKSRPLRNQVDPRLGFVPGA